MFPEVFADSQEILCGNTSCKVAYLQKNRHPKTIQPAETRLGFNWPQSSCALPTDLLTLYTERYPEWLWLLVMMSTYATHILCEWYKWESFDDCSCKMQILCLFVFLFLFRPPVKLLDVQFQILYPAMQGLHRVTTVWTYDASSLLPPGLLPLALHSYIRTRWAN